MKVFLISPWDETDPETVRGAPDQAYLVRGMLEKAWEVKRIAPVVFRIPQLLRLAFFPIEIALNTIVIPLKVIRWGKPHLVLCLDGKLALGALLVSGLTRAKLAKFQHGIKDYLTRRNRLLGFLVNPDVPLNYWTPGLLFAVEDGSGAWVVGPKRVNPVRLPQARPSEAPDIRKDKRFAFCGRLHRIKGAERFLRVARMIRESIPSAKCLVIGEGPLSEDFKKEPWIEILGDLPHREAVRWIATARVLCAVAPYGNFTLPVLEAMSAGTVPVAFDVGWTRDMIGPGGVLVPLFDEKAMAEEVIRLLEDDDVFWEKSRLARERARDFPTWEERTDEILKRLEALCSKGSF
ncbi:MAG: glycosyltransferase family 4 protein [candidate division WOR-3 bacterium]